MENKQIQKYQEFLRTALLIDQTSLVDSILKPTSNPQRDYLIQNSTGFSVTLSNGELVGTKSLLEEIIADYESVIKDKQAKQHEHLAWSELGTLQQEIRTLETDLALLEKAVFHERYVYHWLYVPFWLAKELVSFGQVLLNCEGCHFWGITAISGDNSRNSVLKSLFDELTDL
ncbi:hypothetical protein [Chitinophaga flava]|uniref:Uncharacterized protein n=1 Tax=Chitinophaga flava TaxID=2259036 RepID=A0A365Y416_9BACT|nr:hypothetical protein [Chitinophaga flava]RBL93332.1 hypothetical protein DF182_12465 [Chitinophaga flava]